MDLIIEKLNKMYSTNNIPNIIFHGKNLTCKKTYLLYLLKLLYKTHETFNKYVIIVNCSHGKGNIKLIRENLKHFANIIITNKESFLFKSIVLLNADKLTIDAQSALRRCIEIYNHTTRFFIVVDDKFKLLKPILSRFSEIYCNKKITFPKINEFTNKKMTNLNKLLISNRPTNISELIDLTQKLYNNAYTADMLLKIINNTFENEINKYNFLFLINIYKKEIKNELLLILFCLNFIYFRKDYHLENINLM